MKTSITEARIRQQPAFKAGLLSLFLLALATERVTAAGGSENSKFVDTLHYWENYQSHHSQLYAQRFRDLDEINSGKGNGTSVGAYLAWNCVAVQCVNSTCELDRSFEDDPDCNMCGGYDHHFEESDTGMNVSVAKPRIFEPGCCIGPNCTEDDVCGSHCPDDPYPCKPESDDCQSIDCINCNQRVNEENLYAQYVDFALAINCLDFGHKTSSESGEYDWAIACGPLEEPRNHPIHGAYSCQAFRQGSQIKRTMSERRLCYEIQMKECGCGPPDFPSSYHYLYNFAEPRDPELGWTPCLTMDDCPYLCSDAGEEYAKNLCYAFGGVDWWEGNDTSFDYAAFDSYWSMPNASVQITINAVDSVDSGSGDHSILCGWIFAVVLLFFNT